MTVTSPTASTVVSAGDDFATEVLGDPWDMSNAADIPADESGAVANQSFSGGYFSGTTTSSDNNIFPLFMGYSGSLNTSRGFQHPIDPTHYRYVVMKIKESAPTVANITFLENDTLSYNQGTCGQTYFTQIPDTNWQILVYDMVTNNVTGAVCAHQWLDFTHVDGLRIDPAEGGSTSGGITFTIDWIRLTAPASAAAKTNVSWTDSGSTAPYTIIANETGNNPATYTLATNVSGTSYNADLSFLPPGQYTITVARSGASTTSEIFRINAPPVVTITSPNIRGDQTQNFAKIAIGNPWGPIDGGDFLPNNGIVNFKVAPPNSSYYSYRTGAFYGRPTNSDPEWYMNTAGHSIDTSVYRSLCFTLEDYGPRNIGLGSVARFFWGTLSTGVITTSQDVPLNSGLNEYCFPDLTQVPTENGGTGGSWSGLKTLFRVDPHEFAVSSACTSNPSPSNCHDVELDSVILSPLYTAAPGFTFTWNTVDSDDASVNVSLYLDSDVTAQSFEIYNSASPASSAGTPGQYAWPGSGSINYGLYHAVIVGDDGRNSVAQTSSGPLLIGPSDGIFRNGFDVN